MHEDCGELTVLLRAWSGGDKAALDRLAPLIERELNRIARRCLFSERANCSISATALVNEAFLRLIEIKRMEWHDRAHFLAMTARVMRRVLVDLARAQRAEKRGGNAIRVTFDEALVAKATQEADLIRLDDALQALAVIDERKSKVIELRFFAGLDVEETAAVLQVSSKTVTRDWNFALAWLQREMGASAR